MMAKRKQTSKTAAPRRGRQSKPAAADGGAAVPSASGGAGSSRLPEFGLQHMFRRDRTKRGLGWLRDLPDFRDTTLDPNQARLQLPHHKDALVAHGKASKSIAKRLSQPSKLASAWTDNEQYCSSVEDQGHLGSCTANAAAGMVEYMENRAQEQYLDASRLFLYKVTRNLLGWTGDTGAYLRTTMKALVLFGSPPEMWWPYDDLTTFDNEPDAFLYSFAANYKAIHYMRLDPPELTGKQVLANIKASLATGYVSMFGFPVYSSLTSDADIPFPTPRDSLSGGHAILAVGYDNKHSCPNATQGALRIRNSWGTGWGENGYGWLPYDYVLKGLATDFWTCFKQDWVNTRRFD